MSHGVKGTIHTVRFIVALLIAGTRFKSYMASVLTSNVKNSRELGLIVFLLNKVVLLDWVGLEPSHAESCITYLLCDVHMVNIFIHI